MACHSRDFRCRGPGLGKPYGRRSPLVVVSLELDPAVLASGTASAGLAIPALIAALREAIGSTGASRA